MSPEGGLACVQVKYCRRRDRTGKPQMIIDRLLDSRADD
jgi:hypothetical protein